MGQLCRRLQASDQSLSRKYRRIRADIEPLVERLQAGQTSGDQVQGVDYTVYKVRMRNTATQRGRRGGYRIIYYVHDGDDVLLVTIYFKAEQSDISDAEVVQIIEDKEGK